MFFEQALNSERFDNFWNSPFWNFLEELAIQAWRNATSQVDGASLYNVILCLLYGDGSLKPFEEDG